MDNKSEPKNKLELKSIYEQDGESSNYSFKNFAFYVKDYQRGYRWGEKEIIYLLEDINELEENDKYCLQPLVVKPTDTIEGNSIIDILKFEEKGPSSFDYKWELIDGQQRLTTLLLIIHVCNANFKIAKDLPYNIFYENIRSLDKHFLTEAVKVIKKWFESKKDEEEAKNKILSRVKKNLEFIWYEVPKKTDANVLFTKINIEKIPLTSAELLKAELLNPDNLQSWNNNSNLAKYKTKLNQIAFEWDKIEQSLRDDEFWFFLSNENQNVETRIDYLLKLLAYQKSEKISINIKEYDNLFSFLVINDYLKQFDKREERFLKLTEIWEEIVAIHDTLKSWSKDRELYHYIGFLIHVKNIKEKYVYELMRKTNNCSSIQEIRQTVLKDIQEEFININLDELEYGSNNNKIKKVLLFFNVATIASNLSADFFSFYHFNKEKWEIEHIRPQSYLERIHKIKKAQEARKLLEELKSQYKELIDSGYKNNFNNYDDCITKIDEYIVENLDRDPIDSDALAEFYEKLVEIEEDFEMQSLGNLTLLNCVSNKEVSNNLFPVKRLKIINLDKSNCFIPVCTKNVFFKYYSKDFTKIMLWTKEDADAYLQAIKDTFKEVKICLKEKA